MKPKQVFHETHFCINCLFVPATELCELLPGGPLDGGVPRFFRVGDDDVDSAAFPPATFTSLSLLSASAEGARAAEARWEVHVGFYLARFYDWEVVFREIGEDDVNSSNRTMFYKTRHTLARHIEEEQDWAPKNETLRAR